MIKSKLHNPIIAKNSHIENAVVEKVTLVNEQIFSNIENISPVVPETGRVWYNTDSGTFKFANLGNGINYVDEFLSRTDLRHQTVLGKIDFNDTIKINATDKSNILTVDSLTKDITITGSNTSTTLTGNITNTVNGNIEETVNGNFIGTYSQLVTLKDSNGNKKLEADHITNKLTANYSSILVNGITEVHTLSDKFIINDGTTDKIFLDNTNDIATITYLDVIVNGTNIINNTQELFAVTDGTNDKIVGDHTNNTLDVNYSEITITGNTTIDGNMVVNGDLIVGGQTTKVNIAAENMTIADNVIILNSNLTDQIDPRLASAIVDGEDVDNNAGVAINRGSEGILDLIKWIESTEINDASTLKDGVAKVSIWDYEAATPSYELYQIIDAYTLGRKTKDVSGASWVGYDGNNGENYTSGNNVGTSDSELADYTFKIEPNSLDNVLDQIVNTIDSIKFNKFNTVRVGETPSVGTEFTITHNLGTVYVDVRIQREDNGSWLFDTMPIQVIDADTVKIVTTESTKIRYMITAVEGFDINQATELVVS